MAILFDINFSFQKSPNWMFFSLSSLEFMSLSQNSHHKSDTARVTGISIPKSGHTGKSTVLVFWKEKTPYWIFFYLPQIRIFTFELYSAVHNSWCRLSLSLFFLKERRRRLVIFFSFEISHGYINVDLRVSLQDQLGSHNTKTSSNGGPINDSANNSANS